MADKLKDPIEYLKGVGPARAEILKKELDIHTFGDLLHYYPFRYVDRSRFFKVRDVISDRSFVQLRGRISRMQVIGQGRARRATALFTDDTGSLELIWFKGLKWIINKFSPGIEYVVFGKPAYFNNKYNIPHPETVPASDFAEQMQGNLQPYYNSTEKLKAKGLDSKGIAKLMRNLLPQVKNLIGESLSEEIIEKYRFPDRRTALLNIHFPQSSYELKRAEARLKFEEFFFIQLLLLKNRQIRREKIKGYRFSAVGEKVNTFYHKKLPFELTGAQKKVIKEIRADLGSGKQMNRLLQGDVGSGKTLVAIMTILIALDNDFQACLMAPTEILAGQHYSTFTSMLSGLGISVALLTGSTATAERKNILDALANRKLDILIGTHALIQERVKFGNLGLVVIDEQHRFGVAQRAEMWKKSHVAPHVLIMTATPIPRTMAMTLYGDLEVSVIDELPPGRKAVKTIHLYDKDRLRLFGFIKTKIREGRQVYIVYPLIRESEKLDLKDLTDGYESIVREFPLPEYAVGMLHGQMNQQAKDYEMDRFQKGQIQILVSTTVIEVGVDVPNASVMVIENAERFGLSQLHQLRGRVGRGSDQSWCILMTKEKLTHEARKRIQTMVRTTDGFEIAETDLQLRGPGDIQGIRQSGMINLQIADLVKDEKILKIARQLAARVIDEDPELKMNKNRPLAYWLKEKSSATVGWGMIG